MTWKGKKETAAPNSDKGDTASAKALGLQRLWRLDKAKEAMLVGGFMYNGKSVRHSVGKLETG